MASIIEAWPDEIRVNATLRVVNIVLVSADILSMGAILATEISYSSHSPTQSLVSAPKELMHPPSLKNAH